MQLMMIQFNEMFQNFLLPLLLTGLSFIGTLSIFSTIAFCSSLPPLILFYMGSVTIVFLAGVIYSAACNIHESSRKWLVSLKTMQTSKNLNLDKRKLFYLPMLKCRFGYWNFLERSTCLVVLDFTAASVLNLLLAWRNSV